ncbi:MAG: hypothetical protein ACOYON_01230 [Fimbriimonas sp.]
MKLNLLPKSVNTQSRAKTALIVSIFIVLLSVAGGVGMALWSSQQLTQTVTEAREIEPAARRAVDTSARADTIIASAADIIKNTNLAQAMIAHNAVYSDFYDRVIPYIPSFYRISTLNATPSDATTVSLNLTGTIKTHQQYADLMLALMRIPGAQSISRSGYQIDDPSVPPLSQEDQLGLPRKNGDTLPSDDPYQRLVALETSVPAGGFSNVANYGAQDPLTRGALPDWSLVSVTVIIQETPKFKANLQTPNPRATISSGGGGGAAAPAGLPAAAPSTATGGGGGRGPRTGDDE